MIINFVDFFEIIKVFKYIVIFILLIFKILVSVPILLTVGFFIFNVLDFIIVQVNFDIKLIVLMPWKFFHLILQFRHLWPL